MEHLQQGTVTPHSSAVEWRGINVVRYLVPGSLHLRDPQVDGHRIAFNMGDPLYVKWRDHRGWQGRVYETGAMAIVPDQEGNEVTWSRDLRATVISLQPSYADRLFEKANIQISGHRGITDHSAYQLAHALDKELNFGNAASLVLGDSLGVALTTHLVMQYGKLPGSLCYPKGELSSRQLKSVIDYCQEMMGKPISLEDLAAVTHMSVFHFLRQFKRSVGSTPYQYVLKMRIERPVQLLKTQKQSLSDTAFLLGFTDQAHFCNVFKKMTGYPPKKLV